jgi:hypothetical protein
MWELISGVQGSAKVYLLLRGRRSASNVADILEWRSARMHKQVAIIRWKEAAQASRKNQRIITMERGDKENDVGERKDRAGASGEKKTEGGWI